MTKLEESPDLVRSIYGQAYNILKNEPWNQVDEFFIFGLENLRTKEIFYVQLTGALGECRAVSFYRGGRGLHFLLSLYHASSMMSPFEICLTCDKLELSFAEKPALMPRDQELIRISGIPYKPKGLLPMLRRYRPGYFPWFVQPEEAEFINTALCTLIPVISDVKAGKLIVASPLEEDRITVFHSFLKGNDELHLAPMNVPLPKAEQESIYPAELDELRLKKIMKEKNRTTASWILGGGFFSEEPVQETEESAPFYPFVIVTMDSRSGFVMHHDISRRDEVTDKVVEAILRTIETVGFIPSKVYVPHGHFLQALDPLRDKLGIECEVREKLPLLEEALSHLRSAAMGGPFRGRRTRGSSSTKRKKRKTR